MLIPLRSEQDNGEPLPVAVWAGGPVPAPAAGQAIYISDSIRLGHGSQGCRESWLSADLGTGLGAHRASTQLWREWVQQWELALLTGSCIAQHASTSHPGRGKEACHWAAKLSHSTPPPSSIPEPPRNPARSQGVQDSALG